jgi:hypothetical protein
VKPAGANTMTMGVCTAYVPSGGACLTDSLPCEAGLACVGDDVTTKKNGTCATQGTTVGAACDGTRATQPNCNADLGLVCIPTAKGSAVGTCQTITLAMPGGMCGDVGADPITGFADCQEGYCQKALNDAGVAAATGTCVANVADNAPCDIASTAPGCLAPSKCVPSSAGSMTGTCTVPDAQSCM